MINNEIISKIFETEYGLVGFTFIFLFICFCVTLIIFNIIMKDSHEECEKKKKLKKDKLLEDIKYLTNLKTRNIILDKIITTHPDFKTTYEYNLQEAIENYE